jgi:hypothetical protein
MKMNVKKKLSFLPVCVLEKLDNSTSCDYTLLNNHKMSGSSCKYTVSMELTEELS